MNVNRIKVQNVVGMMSLMATLMLGAMTVQAATTVLIQPRPVTPGNIVSWGLTNTTQKSHGLINNGIGQPIYLEVLVSPTNTVVTNVTWSLTVPTGSVATNLLASPITNGVPAYDIGDQLG